MFGKVIFPYKSRLAEAVLEDDGLWRCGAVPCLVRVLNIRHSPVWHEEPLDPVNARRCLLTAGLWLKGRVLLPAQNLKPSGFVEQGLGDCVPSPALRVAVTSRFVKNHDTSGQA